MSTNEEEQFVKAQQRFRVELEARECRQSSDHCFRVALFEAALRVIQSVKETLAVFGGQELSHWSITSAYDERWQSSRRRLPSRAFPRLCSGHRRARRRRVANHAAVLRRSRRELIRAGTSGRSVPQ